MSAIPAATNGWRQEGLGTQLPPGGVLPLGANQQAGQGQFLTFNASGNLVLNDGATPCVVAAGVAWPEKLSSTSAVAAAAYTSVWTGYGGGAPASTIASDGFSAADQCVPAWIANENALGKLSNYSGSNRALGGLVFGLDADGITPRSWVGPVAQAVARGVLCATDTTLGKHTYAVDAGAATDLTEVLFSSPRAKYHGLITSIEYIPNATLGADASNYKTLTVTKYDSNGANGVVVGTLTTVAGFATKWKGYTFTLSVVAHALEVLEGDNFTIQNSHTLSGAVTPAGVIRVLGKVI